MAVRGLIKTTLQLGTFFAICHLFDVYNKQEQKKHVIKFYPFPMNVTTAQFAVGTVVALVMWITGILQRPKVSAEQLAAILPMAMVHTLVNLFINMSPGIGKVAVSWTHYTNKAPPMEPYYFYYLHLLMRKLGLYCHHLLSSVIFLGQLLAIWFVVSHAPIVTLPSSNNVPNKKLKVNTQKPLDSVNLLSIITIMSFALLAPITFLMEGVKLAGAMKSEAWNLEPMYSTFPFSAMSFHAYQQGLYMILAKVSHLTIKRPNNK